MIVSCCPPLDAREVMWQTPLALVGWCVAKRFEQTTGKRVHRQTDWSAVFGLLKDRASAECPPQSNG